VSDTTPADAGTDSTTPVISVRPVTLAAPNRGQDLRVRVSAPTTGHDLPVVVFSHGMTLSMDSYEWRMARRPRNPDRDQRPAGEDRLEVTSP
jgi:predicted dienelactone hydrolase